MVSLLEDTRPVTEELDVLVVGGGFAGVYALERLRALGFTVKLYEAGSEAGGVWHWNQYPGARVDTEATAYQFSDERIWKEWDWSEMFPGQEELQEYFRFVVDKLELGPEIHYSTRVLAARFDTSRDQWVVESRNENTGETFLTRARFFLPMLGTGSKKLIPNIAGRDTFEGDIFHTAEWPTGYDMRGKRVAVIGTGASGVQVIQSIAPQVESMTVFQRTPSMTLPMYSAKLDHAANEELRKSYPKFFEFRNQTFGGLAYDLVYKPTAEMTDEEFTEGLEKLYAEGGLQIWLGGYADLFFDVEVSNRIYRFWRDKTRGRIKDPVLAEKLVPTEPPYPFGSKRCPLEYTYYEAFNQDNVELVDVNDNRIDHIYENGIVTADGVEREFDVIVLATGFDSFTGGLCDIDIVGTNGETFGETYANGVHTLLGRATSGFPNILFVYGPQSPSAFCNGPTCAELEGDWVIDCLVSMRERGLTRIEATPEGEKEWQQHFEEVTAATIFPLADSWYMNANVPGKKRELLAYPGGLAQYLKKNQESAENDYAGFVRT
ncbi:MULTISPECIES: flavin-containing monooxygenase [Rhodococcus]|uniref:NAD(P)/FAD-dependent oxidoreductase n=2 Tax=Rhodococcus TaxID=1827 RepID=A0AA46PU04_9NOCA|nr:MULTISPECIES: NAD(P)/FAD-dependent oxidoreductase [Rhodococcus]KHJ72580.1 cyclopentanone 1,2-monooxygenase [Rhodococcus sp. Chr-9]MCD2114761.1 NAD(P)/FAD-dependent oxidoreductase [Rhodococcus rhodochrous]MCD5422806.1 NAD(P)/FAD-dependent oxidoreductase [Rhodococcus pyridinivorans]MDC3729018.1 NAD(P)/FAD-dependent oxidoreductase [Rhodococcus sp. Rp3]MDV6297215.1 NAD(P)/FAD-dependent oxidoreductase [Rhodococcus aetherivorans]